VNNESPVHVKPSKPEIGRTNNEPPNRQ
jgi:hypothetical protein